MSVPVPGAPPLLPDDGAAIGLSFLDSALRLNHVRRLTERLTVIDHRVARRVTEVDVSLRMLDASQRRASALAQELRGRDPAVGPAAGPVWVPVARLPRTSAAPVDIRDAAGARLPHLTQHESSTLLAAGLYRLHLDRRAARRHPGWSRWSRPRSRLGCPGRWCRSRSRR